MIAEKDMLIELKGVFVMVYLRFRIHDVNGGFGGVDMGQAASFLQNVVTFNHCGK